MIQTTSAQTWVMPMNHQTVRGTRVLSSVMPFHSWPVVW